MQCAGQAAERTRHLLCLVQHQVHVLIKTLRQTERQASAPAGAACWSSGCAACRQAASAAAAQERARSMWATGTRSRSHVHRQQPAAAAAHNDAALDPQVVVLVQPYLDFLSALQEPENQVLREQGRAGDRQEGAQRRSASRPPWQRSSACAALGHPLHCSLQLTMGCVIILLTLGGMAAVCGGSRGITGAVSEQWRAATASGGSSGVVPCTAERRRRVAGGRNQSPRVLPCAAAAAGRAARPNGEQQRPSECGSRPAG